jgi:hypothetical protein
MQVLLDWTIAAGMGLAGCWICIVTFMALRLVMNVVRLLRPESVLSQTEPLSDKMESLETLVKSREEVGVVDTDSPYKGSSTWPRPA